MSLQYRPAKACLGSAAYRPDRACTGAATHRPLGRRSSVHLWRRRGLRHALRPTRSGFGPKDAHSKWPSLVPTRGVATCGGLSQAHGSLEATGTQESVPPGAGRRKGHGQDRSQCRKRSLHDGQEGEVRLEDPRRRDDQAQQEGEIELSSGSRGKGQLPRLSVAMTVSRLTRPVSNRCTSAHHPGLRVLPLEFSQPLHVIAGRARSKATADLSRPDPVPKRLPVHPELVGPTLDCPPLMPSQTPTVRGQQRPFASPSCSPMPGRQRRELGSGAGAAHDLCARAGMLRGTPSGVPGRR